MNKKINEIILALVLMMPIKLIAQQVNIGNNATYVRGQIDWLIRDYNQHEPIGNFTMRYETKWSNGKIAEVDLKRNGVPHVSRSGQIKNLSFNTRYIMSNGKLARILKEYYNLSLDELRQQQNEEYINVSGYYFEHDYKTYASVFKGTDGLATLEVMQTNVSKLPPNVQKLVKEKQREYLGAGKTSETSGIQDTISFIITSSSVGRFKIGQDISSIKVSYPYKEIKTQERRYSEDGETFEPFYNIGKDQELIMKIKPNYNLKTKKYENLIDEINIYSSRSQTAEGIGVGATIEEFIQKYTDYKIWYTYVSEKIIIETSQLKNVQFELDNNAFIGRTDSLGKKDIDILSTNDIDKKRKIVSIRIY